MNILALDTSTEVAGVALLEGERVRFSYSFFHRMDLAQRLLPALHWLLQDAGMALTDVQGVAVGLGPGSFTGIRTGVTLAKVLAQATSLPLVGVSTLAVMAATFLPCQGRLVCPCIDARKHEVYAALYHMQPDGPKELLPPQALTAATLAQHLKEKKETAIFCGTGARRYEGMLRGTLGEGFQYQPGHDFPDPIVLAHLAQRRLERGDHDNPLLLKPIYARLSEAERTFCRGAREKGGQ